MALQKGYKILQIYEIYHFEQSSQYDPLSGEGGLFTNYVNTFLKIKQEASGFPPECDTEESKRNYIRRYLYTSSHGTLPLSVRILCLLQHSSDLQVL